MQTDSVELSFLSIFAFITFFIFLVISKYSYKINNGILLDKDFLKPQAFNNELDFIIYYLIKLFMNIFLCVQVCFWWDI